MTIRFTRCFAMPNAETFSVKPIGEFVQRFLVEAKVSVDPFARNRDWATYTNDIDMTTCAQSHQDAEKFLYELGQNGVIADLAIFDPPYSPRQISEHYRAAGLGPDALVAASDKLSTGCLAATRSLASCALVGLSYPSDGNRSGWASTVAMSFLKRCWLPMEAATTIRSALQRGSYERSRFYPSQLRPTNSH